MMTGLPRDPFDRLWPPSPAWAIRPARAPLVFALAIAAAASVIGCTAEGNGQATADREQAAAAGQAPASSPSPGDTAAPAAAQRSGDRATGGTGPQAATGEAEIVPDEPALAAVPDAPASALGAYDFEADPTRLDLPSELDEVSGLAIDGSGRLFAHQDERAIVYQIDPRTGALVHAFQLGRNGLRGDFEGIAVAGQRMFLVASEGVLYAFSAPGGGEESEYEVTRLGTGNRCSEIEGVDYDARADELLLACKTTRGRELRDRLIVFALSLRTNALVETPRLNVALDVLDQADLKAGISPSGIAVHPLTGTFFVIAARENVIVELSRTGELLGSAKLRGRVHRQPEGIAFAADGTLYIADEAPSGRAKLSVYTPDVARLRPATE